MDVHPPHGAIHSLKDFLVHLLAITIGLLIALGLEGSVTWMHHRQLVHEAKQNVSQEILKNRAGLNKELSALPAEDKHLKELLHQAIDMQTGKSAALQPDYGWEFQRLSDAAWSSSLATGATSFMQYDEVAQYEQLYFVQQAFNTLLNRYVDSRLEMYAFLESTNTGDKLSPSEVEGLKHAISSQIMTNHAMHEVGSQLDAGYGRFLEGEK